MSNGGAGYDNKGGFWGNNLAFMVFLILILLLLSID